MAIGSSLFSADLAPSSISFEMVMIAQGFEQGVCREKLPPGWVVSGDPALFELTETLFKELKPGELD